MRSREAELGFDLVVKRTDDVEDGEGWFACGWDKAALFRALCALGEEDEGCCATVPTHSMRFVADAGRRVAADPSWDRYGRLTAIDRGLAEEWLCELPADARADMALALMGDAGDERELDVLREMWELALDGWPDVACDLGSYVSECDDAGVGELHVFGG